MEPLAGIEPASLDYKTSIISFILKRQETTLRTNRKKRLTGFPVSRLSPALSGDEVSSACTSVFKIDSENNSGGLLFTDALPLGYLSQKGRGGTRTHDFYFHEVCPTYAALSKWMRVRVLPPIYWLMRPVGLLRLHPQGLSVRTNRKEVFYVAPE